jgi:hypothetical protein
MRKDGHAGGPERRGVPGNGISARRAAVRTPMEASRTVSLRTHARES